MPNTVNSYMVTDLGNVSPNPRGEYNATYDYEYLDLVYYKGGSYVCLAPLGETIANVAPIAGQTTTNWQCVAIPGDITPEYISMYNEVVKDYNETNTNTADVAQMKASTYASMTAAQESESKASTSETNARNSEVNAKQSMDKAKEYSDEAIRVNNDTQSLVTGFDEHVATAISNAESSISESTDNAKGEIIAQKSSSLNEFRTDAETVMTNEKNVAVTEIHQMIDDFSADADSKKQEVITVADEKINDMTALKNDTVNAKNAAETAATTAVEKASETATYAGEAKASSDEAKANADLVAADKAIVAADKTEIGGMKSAVESSVAKFESDLETYNLPTMNNDINELKSDLINSQSCFDINTESKIDGYITHTGTINSRANYYIVNNINLKKGQKIVVCGLYETSVTVIAERNTKLYVHDYRAFGSPYYGTGEYATYEYEAEEDINIAITIPYSNYSAKIYTLVENSSIEAYKDITLDKLVTVFNDYIEISENVFDDNNALTGRLLNNKGKIAWFEEDKTSQPIYCYGKNKVYVHSVIANGIQALVFAFYDENMNFISESPSWVTSADIPLNAYYLRVDFTKSIYNSYNPMVTFSPIKPTEYIPYAIKLKKYPVVNSDYLYLFRDIAIIGDSLSSGEVYTEGGTPDDKYNYSWLSYICRSINATPHHYSQGGMSTKSWINSHWKTDLETETSSNAYYIALGTNDKNQTGYAIGTIDDSIGQDSFVGYYKQIINIIHTKAPNSVIFCVSMYGSDNGKTEWSNMIEAISSLYDYCYYVDFANKAKSDLLIPSSRVYTNYIENWHYTGLGYIEVGETMKEITNQIIYDNLDSFKFFTANQ